MEYQREDTPVVSTPSQFLRWSVVVLLALFIGVTYYAYSTRRALNERIANVERANNERVTTEVTALKSHASSLSSNVKALDGRLGETAQALDAANQLATRLRVAQDRLSKSVTANAGAIKSVREDTTDQLEAVNGKVGTVSSQIQSTAAALETTKTQVAENRRDLTSTEQRLASQITKNSNDVEALRRHVGHDVFEFDLRKSDGEDLARIEDISLQLRKADARNAKYEVTLFMDDRRIEMKNLVANELVQFLVGKDRVRYEMVVTSVGRDQIRGLVRVPKDRPQMNARATP
jgi:DNA repair exonuclease SbcCD ATPase subunit